MFATKDWVAVEQQVETKTAGGIIIPDKAQKKNAPYRGIVILAGCECKYVRENDRVMFSSKDAFYDQIGAVTCVFIAEKDVMVVLNRDVEEEDCDKE